MMDASKYKVGYFPVSKEYNKWVEKDHVEKAPIWCSVDMRDGNQSLVIPMSLEEKLEYYKVLLQVGFKEIEVGFPAASAASTSSVRHSTRARAHRARLSTSITPSALHSASRCLRSPRRRSRRSP